jgi:hypothetical protein
MATAVRRRLKGTGFSPYIASLQNSGLQPLRVPAIRFEEYRLWQYALKGTSFSPYIASLQNSGLQPLRIQIAGS